MTSPVQALTKAHYSDGVDIQEAKNLLIYVDDQPYIGESLGMMIINVVNPNTDNLTPLPQLSYQFLQSSGGLEQTVRGVQGLIHQAPADCQIGIILDHDQKEFMGHQLAKEIQERCSSPLHSSRIKIAAYTANAHMNLVAEKWQGLGACFPKIETGINMKATITAMFKYLLHEN